jgi:hypothetical protein
VNGCDVGAFRRSLSSASSHLSAPWVPVAIQHYARPKNHSCMEYIVPKYSWVKAEGTGNGRILSLPLHTSGTKLHVGLGFPVNVCNGAVKTS